VALKSQLFNKVEILFLPKFTNISGENSFISKLSKIKCKLYKK